MIKNVTLKIHKFSKELINAKVGLEHSLIPLVNGQRAIVNLKDFLSS
jgi:hypothetical protein